MMRRTSKLAALLLVLGAPAWAAEPIQPPELCRDDRSTCREDCSLQFGTVARQRPKLLRCLEFCAAAHQACEERYFEAYRQMEEKKKLAEKNKPDLALPRTPVPEETGRPAAPASPPAASTSPTTDGKAATASEGTSATAPPAATRYTPISTEASSFSSADEVEKLSTTPAKPKAGKKGAASTPAASPSPSDLSTWDPSRP